ncbi:hypothetical protein S40293_08316 [Stachybotrys chartarum IBT 40293]|nr:hypothetical protein S40293_08316 [Stachybotrys chartarum IBT 40293]KFA71734.1 hypothetical protein S40288_09679 [Stachybotrys chartarum IBT 40288]
MVQLLAPAAVLAAAAFTPAYSRVIAHTNVVRDDTTVVGSRIPFIVRCPEGEAVLSAGDGIRSDYLGCPGAVYEGADSAITRNVASPGDCAEICAENAACDKAVWDSVSLTCAVKAQEPEQTLFWVMRDGDRYTSITRNIIRDPSVEGEWTDLFRYPVVPIAAYVVPASPQPERILFFSAYHNDTFGGTEGKTQFADFNFVTGEISHREVANTHHDMFCPGISQLEDGRIIINGGSNADAVTFYEPFTNTFVEGPKMVQERGYQSSATTSTGKVFVLGGSFYGPLGGKNGELYDPATNEWTDLPGADVNPILTDDFDGIWRSDNHAWLFAWKNESVFQAGPSKDQHWFQTNGTGAVSFSSTRDEDHAMCGVFVLYDAVKGKIFSAGGSPSYTSSPAQAHAHITTIGEPGVPAVVERIPDMAFARSFANVVVLPDGTLLVTGGQRYAVVFTNDEANYLPELYNPETNEWTQLAPAGIPRNYHSVSLLLPDASVLSAGGGGCATYGPDSPIIIDCGDQEYSHPDGQIFYPPYLFNEDGSRAERPVITSVHSTRVEAGSTIRFTVSGGATTFSLIRMGTATHSVNTDQRRIPLYDAIIDGENVSAVLPNDYGILLPGYYYLFAVSEAGVPSIAETIHVVFERCSNSTATA